MEDRGEPAKDRVIGSSGDRVIGVVPKTREETPPWYPVSAAASEEELR